MRGLRDGPDRPLQKAWSRLKRATWSLIFHTNSRLERRAKRRQVRRTALRVWECSEACRRWPHARASVDIDNGSFAAVVRDGQIAERESGRVGP